MSAYSISCLPTILIRHLLAIHPLAKGRKACHVRQRFVMFRRFGHYRGIGGRILPEVSTVVVSVSVVDPPGVVVLVLVVFLTSAFFSQPTKTTARLSMHSGRNRFMIKLPCLATCARTRTPGLCFSHEGRKGSPADA